MRIPDHPASRPRTADPSARPRSSRPIIALPLLALVALLATYVLAVRTAIDPDAPPLPSAVVELLPVGRLDESDGLLPEDRIVTVHETELPAITNLDPQLLVALRAAAGQAAEDGVSFQVNSAWRSPAYQQSLWKDAVRVHGSREEAARWVASAETSSHVHGDAIDLGPVDATSWLSQHGSEFGLCQTYANEPWHYELRSEAAAEGCPAQYADPTEDPRLRP